MRRPLLWMTAAACASLACSPPRVESPPADVTMSFGIVQNVDPSPPAGATVKVKFLGEAAGQNEVLAKRVTRPIQVDGDASDWEGVPETTVALMPAGAMIGLSREQWDSEFAAYVAANPEADEMSYDAGAVASGSVRVAYDDRNIYFLFRWADPSESRSRGAWTYANGAWRPSTEAEDKLFISFGIENAAHDALGCAYACHFRDRMGDYGSESLDYRLTMHTSAPGELVDSWNWMSSKTDMLGLAEDDYWDEESTFGDCPEAICTERVDASLAAKNRSDDGSLPRWMSADGVNASPAALFDPSVGLTPVAVPFDDRAVAPVEGARLPGYAITALPGANRREIKAKGRWSGGVWTVEFSRALVTGDPRDVQFPRVERRAAAGAASALRPTYASISQNLFASACMPCHHGTPPAVAPNSLDPESAYAANVGVASSQDPSSQRIDPARPGSSYLLRKLKGEAGSRMPPVGPSLSPADIAVIESWIAAGAPRG